MIALTTIAIFSGFISWREHRYFGSAFMPWCYLFIGQDFREDSFLRHWTQLSGEFLIFNNKPFYGSYYW